MTDIATDIRLPALVLAGAPADAEMAGKYAVKNRAEVPIAGKPMIQHVLDALKASSHVMNTCVIGDISCSGAGRIIPTAGKMMDNLLAGMRACGDEGTKGLVLVVTSDIPLITSEAIDYFIAACAREDADFYYPVISKESSEARFPGVKRTYAKLAEGTFTGGNIMAMGSRFVIENEDVLRGAMAARKSVPRLAGLIGVGTLIRAIIAQTVYPKALSIRDLEAAAGRVLHARLKAIQVPYPEIGADVDTIEQLESMERLISTEGELR